MDDDAAIEIPTWITDKPEQFQQGFYLPSPLLCLNDFGNRDYTAQECRNCFVIGHPVRACPAVGITRLHDCRYAADTPIDDPLFRKDEEIRYLYSNRNYYQYRAKLAEDKTAFLINKINRFANNNIPDCAHCPFYRDAIAHCQQQISSYLAEIITTPQSSYAEVIPNLRERITRRLHLSDTINNNFDERATDALNIIERPWMDTSPKHISCRIRNLILKNELTYWVKQAIELRDKQRIGPHDCLIPQDQYFRMLSFVECNRCGAKGEHLPENCEAVITDTPEINVIESANPDALV